MLKLKHFFKKSKIIVKFYRKLKYKIRILSNLFKSDISKNREKMKFSEIKDLCSDIAELNTNEIYICNDFYGNATTIKKYIKMNKKKSIKAAIEHGIYYADHYWSNDVNSDMPVLFTPSQKRVHILKKVTKQKVYAIGPLIHYAENIITDEIIGIEKNKNGKTLLVFPVHSTHHNEVKYNVSEFCEEIEKVREKGNFNAVMICMYWKDVLRGYEKEYLEYGYKCVTAGHIYDLNFLSRLKAIIKLADITMSNAVGTHVGYCIYLNKPHYLIDTEHKYDIKNYHEESKKFMDKYQNDEGILKIKNIFSIYEEEITPEQREIVSEFWGTDSIKTPKEMLEIIKHAETLYRKRQ